MKKEFSNKWKASSQIRKQRKFLANAPKNIKQKLMSASLSKDLKTKYNRRSFQIKKGDTVKILRGSFKKKTGKINTVDIKNCVVSIEGIQITRKDGTKVNTFFHPSKLQITDINLEDKKRFESIQKNKMEKK